MTARTEVAGSSPVAPRSGRNGSRRRQQAAPALRHATTWGPLAVLAVLIVLFSLASGTFLTVDNFKTLADQSAVALVLATGMTFIVVQGSIDLSLEGTMSLCSIVVALLVANNINGNDLGWLGVAVGVAVGVAFGLANGLLYTYLRLPSLMVTLGTWFIGLGLASMLFPGRQPKIAAADFRSLALSESLGVTRLFFVALACVAVGYAIQRWTRLGRYSFAIGGGEEIAALSGIPVRRYKILAFTFAGLMIGIAAMLATARGGFGDAAAGNGYLFPTIAAVVIGGTLLSGGRGGVLHSAVGVLILTVLDNGMILVGVDPYIQSAVQGALIVAAVVGSTWVLRSRMRVVK